MGERNVYLYLNTARKMVSVGARKTDANFEDRIRAEGFSRNVLSEGLTKEQAMDVKHRLLAAFKEVGYEEYNRETHNPK